MQTVSEIRSTVARNRGWARGGIRSTNPADSGDDMVDLMGLTIHRLTLAEVVDRVAQSLEARRGGWVVTPNLDILRRWWRDRQFRGLISRSTLRVADGMPLVWASWIQGTPLPGRVNGTDLMLALASAAAENHRSIYLLGGEVGAAEAAAAVLQRRLPTLTIAGMLCPPVGFERDPAMMREMVESLTRASPDLVFVALGCPKQERLITLLEEKLPHAWWFGIGVSFSFIGGIIPRAPLWMQRSGLEWLHRLWHEPGRLAVRYLVHGLPFGMRVFLNSVLIRIRSRRQDMRRRRDDARRT